MLWKTFKKLSSMNCFVACAETMIAEGSNTNAIKLVIPTLVSPANVFSATGVTLTDAVPTVEFVLLDQDQAAAVSILTFDTTNVSGVKVTLFDKSDAEVKTTEVRNRFQFSIVIVL